MKSAVSDVRMPFGCSTLACMDSGSVTDIRGAIKQSAGGNSAASEVAHGVPDDDAHLMVRYRDGDLAAFQMLYARHKSPLYRYLQRSLHAGDAVNDVFQEVWSKLIASRRSYEPKAQFNTFLYRIAHNCVMDHFRRSARHREAQTQDIGEMAEEIQSTQASPEEVLSHTQFQARFRRALDELPLEQREVFVLYEESGMSLDDIGRITGVAMETAKSRLRYAVGKLRNVLRLHRTGEQV
jgi:RNA polymerase sigma-70 factor, ECF subfamily